MAKEDSKWQPKEKKEEKSARKKCKKKKPKKVLKRGHNIKQKKKKGQSKC